MQNVLLDDVICVINDLLHVVLLKHDVFEMPSHLRNNLFLHHLLLCLGLNIHDQSDLILRVELPLGQAVLDFQ